MYSLILTDVDGTLIKDNGTLSENTIYSLKKARDKGIRLCIASGRYIKAIEFFKDELKIEDIILSGINGAIIVDNNKILRSVKIDKEAYKIASSYVYKKAKSIIAFSKDKYAIDSNNDFFFLQEKICRQKGIRMDIRNIEEVENSLGEEVYKIIIKDTDIDIINNLKKDLRELLKGKAQIISSALLNLEVLPLKTDKVDTVYTLEKELGIKREEMIAFGDWDNDAQMLHEVGAGVAMGNSSDVTKRNARYITKTNEEDGLSYALKEILHVI